MTRNCFSCAAVLEVEKFPSIVDCPECHSSSGFVDLDNHPLGREGAVKEILDSIVCRKCKRKGFNRFVDSDIAKCRYCKLKITVTMEPEKPNKFMYETDI